MATVKGYLCVCGLALLTACSSTHPKAEEIVLPDVTPFDGNQLERQVYLDSFKDGYRSAKKGGEFTPRYRKEPYSFARELGWRAGAAAAQNEGAGVPTNH